MDIETGKVYENYDDGVKELKAKGLSKEEIQKRLLPISGDEYRSYICMNRHEKRKELKIARRNRRNKNVE